MTRKDLLEDNWDVLSMYCTWIMKYCPEAILLVVTNPVDVLATLARRRFGGLNVIGLGCSLDTVRFEYHLAEAAGVAVQTVHGLVVGSHDDNMLPLVRLAQIGYAPASDVLTDDQLNDVVDKTRRAGHVIVEKLHRGSWYAAAVIVADIVETILSDSQNTFCLNVPCDGELGFDGVCLSLPTMVGANGAGKPLPLPLNRLETEALRRSGRSIDEAANTAFSKSAGVLSGVVSLSGRG